MTSCLCAVPACAAFLSLSQSLDGLLLLLPDQPGLLFSLTLSLTCLPAVPACAAILSVTHSPLMSCCCRCCCWQTSLVCLFFWLTLSLTSSARAVLCAALLSHSVAG
jgi:hypothetical protein